MDSRTRHKLLSTGRSGDFRNLARDLTNHPDDFPTKTQLKARIEEIYPDAKPEAREAIYGKLVQIAQARKNGADLLELRGVVDEYVLKVDAELTDDDRLIPSDDEDTGAIDVSGVMDAMDNWNPAEKRTRAITNAAKAAELEANRARQMRGN
jgi:hypothetical protein